MPFILRGVALLGMDSVLMVIGPRRKLWARRGDSLRPRYLAEITSDLDVKDFIGVLDEVRAGAFSRRRWCGSWADSELAVAYSKG
jgi:acrylyl-CoA reductase (NADPH)